MTTDEQNKAARGMLASLRDQAIDEGDAQAALMYEVEWLKLLPKHQRARDGRSQSGLWLRANTRRES